MSDKEKYDNVFIDLFELKQEQLDTLEYQAIVNWDSVGHMSLIAGLEEAFNIMMETDDIIDFSSYQKGKEILLKYNIKI